MLHKGMFAVVGVLVLAGSAYGGYSLVREQRMERNRDQEQDMTRAGTRSMEEKTDDTGMRGNRPEGVGGGVPEEGDAHADLVGRIETVGDGYIDLAIRANPGPGSSGVGMDGSTGRPGSEAGEVIRLYIDDGTDYFISDAGPDAGRTETGSKDIAEDAMISVWLVEGDDDTMRAERIVIREGGVVPIR